MTDKEAHDVTHNILKQIQADLAELKQMRQEMPEGFASITSYITGLITDVFSHERRIPNIEDEIIRLKNRLGSEDHQHLKTAFLPPRCKNWVQTIYLSSLCVHKLDIRWKRHPMES